MLRFFVLTLCVSLIWASPHPKAQTVASKNLGSRIFNGQQAAKGQFPYAAAVWFIGDESDGLCGGTIISAEWILTAAYCLYGAHWAIVETGVAQLHGIDSQISESTHFVLPEDYDPSTISNDIGLLKLDEPLTFNENTAAIKLASAPIGGGVPVTASGWGATSQSDQSVSNFLYYVTLVTIPNSQCEEIFGSQVVTERVVCAVSDASQIKSPCGGDSGGPLVMNADTDPVLVGLVSFISIDGCEASYPSGYLQIASFRNWIREITGV